MTRTVALVPAYNEADRVGQTVQALAGLDGVAEVVVIDDGSTDGTAAAASRAGARVVTMARNSGKGAALNRGLAETESDVVLMVDADLGACASQTAALLDPVISGEAEMAIAAMKAPAGHKGGFGLAMRLSRWAIRKLGGAAMITPMSGQRAIARTLLEHIGGFEERFAVETALTIDALRNNYRVVEVPLPLSHRTTGRSISGFLHRGRQFVDIARAVWKRMH